MNYEPIARTGFLTCLASYMFFWSLDLLRPGFVARYFSVHIFLLGVIIFGIWWASVVDRYVDHQRIQWSLSALFGIFLSVIVWKLGGAFGLGRGIVSLIALFVPMLVLRLVKYK